MDPQVQARFELARAAVRRAGALASDYAQRLADLPVRSKGVQDVVTEADVAVEDLLRTTLLTAFPDDTFFGEESGVSAPGASGGMWVVDPIDGTQPFVSGLRDWCISVAYLHHDALMFGIVFAPAADELFEGGVGLPATLNGRQVTVHPGQALTDGIVAVGYSPRIGPDDILPVFDRLLRPGGMYYRSGSGALCLCYVACGRLLGFVEPHINSYDCLGGIAVVRAAGGRTNDFLAGPDALLRGNRMVAGPPALFDTLDAVLGAPVSHSGE